VQEQENAVFFRAEAGLPFVSGALDLRWGETWARWRHRFPCPPWSYVLPQLPAMRQLHGRERPG